MLNKDFPLVEKKSVSIIDCMSTEIEAIDFCKKQEVTNPYLVRAVVQDKTVECISSKKVDIKYRCKNKDSICKNSKFACESLKEKLANRLQLDTHYQVENTKGQQEIVCYFKPKSVKPI